MLNDALNYDNANINEVLLLILLQYYCLNFNNERENFIGQWYVKDAEELSRVKKE